jgi:hypothetical protein
MARSANVAVLTSLGVSAETIRPIPSDELQLIADAILLGRSNLVAAASKITPQTGVAKLRKGSSLETAMKAHGINRKVNAKGDTLVAYHPNRPKYPFVYLSPNGHTRWKQTIEQAQRRFR